MEAKSAMEAAKERVPMDCGGVGGCGQHCIHREDDGGVNAAGSGGGDGPFFRCEPKLCWKTGRTVRKCPMAWDGKYGKGEGKGHNDWRSPAGNGTGMKTSPTW